MSPHAISNIEALLDVLAFAGVFTVCGFVFARLDRDITRKGYQSPYRSVLVWLAFMALAALTLGFACSAPDMCWNCNPARNPEHYRAALMWPRLTHFSVRTAMGGVASWAVMAAIARLMPVAARRGGPRRTLFPWRVVGYACLTGVPLGGILLATGHLHWSQASKVVFAVVTAHAACLRLARREKAPTLTERLEEDPRPPVLYLRPFEYEERTFVMLPTEFCRGHGLPIASPAHWWQPITFESYLAGAVTTELGPFVALGDPNDYLPPSGAARAYLEDEAWQVAFKRLIHDAGALVMTAGVSENVRWELTTIRELELTPRLFIVTRPANGRRWYSLGWSRRREREWAALAKTLEAAGLQPCPYPGDGAVVSFDVAAKAVVVLTDAETPADYARALRSRTERQANS